MVNSSTTKPSRVPSSSSHGTFTPNPSLNNQYREDRSLRRILTLFLPETIVESTTQDLSRFGDEVVSKKVFDWVSDAERNTPYLRGSGRDSFGRKTDELATSEGWRNLQDMGFKEGIVAIAYENEYAEYSRLVQFIKYHIWSGSNANVTCPSAMQDGAASLLKRHLTRDDSSVDTNTFEVYKSAYAHLTMRKSDAWTSGQWMTERVGGSDVSGTETLATYSPFSGDRSLEAISTDGSPLGPWIIDGFKWFSSATDSQMTVLLAQTPKGLSAFFAPMRRIMPSGNSELNGISIQRLKNKMGTKPLPTAELVLKGMRAYLLGKEGTGIQEISTMLNITRVHNSVTAVGLLGRGLAIAKAFAGVRQLVGKGNRRVLKDVGLHVRTLAKLTSEYHADMMITFFTVYLLGISEQKPQVGTSKSSFASERLRPQNYEDVALLLRILTPTIKSRTAKTSITGLQECMEALGGVGYLENEESQHVNISRLYRDANVLAIWEGTTNILGTDFIKVLKSRHGPRTLIALQNWADHALFGYTQQENLDVSIDKKGILSRLRTFKSDIEAKSLEELIFRSRDVMRDFSNIVIAILMVVDVERDDDTIGRELLRRFASQNELGSSSISDWSTEAQWNPKIVFGEGRAELGTTKSRL
ncbi:putative acyl-CoA dehydrogenase [Amylocarpus encephaloides]|uniref:Acyl-CoA dehydrogenase n=1 Tax=Amylocarpus encephaloides TaxID=45428 RepID=A0A9P7YLT8_9HELO|nr:putative acyl-CoA dehydrogenase [Amylocarpus encephaloides]